MTALGRSEGVQAAPGKRAIMSTHSQRSRAAAHRLHATHDSRELTAAGRKKFLDRFLDEVDPERRLPEPERIRRAEHAKRAYFLELSMKSADVRRKRLDQHMTARHQTNTRTENER